METVCNYTGDTAFFSSDERKWINKIRKLAEEHPDEVVIKRQPEKNDGCIYATIPSSWFKIQPKIKREYTDEQRAMFAEKMRKLRSETNG